MFNVNDVNKLMNFATDLLKVHGVQQAQLQNMYGVQTCLDAFNRLWTNPPMGSDVFLKSWYSMLVSNLESAVWLCTYNYSRPSMTQKDAMKLADEMMKRFQKGYES